MSYFGWITALRFSFSPEMLDPIRKFSIGAFDEMKSYVGDLVTKAREKIFGKFSSGSDSSGVNEADKSGSAQNNQNDNTNIDNTEPR